jgi:GLPGLI family protein
MRFTIFITVIWFSFSWGQNNKQGKITYKIVCDICAEDRVQKNDIDLINNIIHDDIEWVSFVLSFKNSESFFEREGKIYPENVLINGLIIDGLMSGGKYHFNYKSGILLNEKFLMGKRYLITSNSNKLNWEISNEQKVISGYTCYKATRNESVNNSLGSFSHEIVAWFAPDLPFQFGPKNNNSLPGLILVLHEKNYSFYADSIDLNISVNMPVLKGKVITEEDFLEEISFR